jgi:hypothetical protein
MQGEEIQDAGKGECQSGQTSWFLLLLKLFRISISAFTVDSNHRTDILKWRLGNRRGVILHWAGEEKS